MGLPQLYRERLAIEDWGPVCEAQVLKVIEDQGISTSDGGGMVSVLTALTGNRPYGFDYSFDQFEFELNVEAVIRLDGSSLELRLGHVVGLRDYSEDEAPAQERFLADAVRTVASLDDAFRTFADQYAGGLLILPREGWLARGQAASGRQLRKAS